MFTSLLIGVQFALSFTYGVELVTVTLATFSVVFGYRKGCIVAISFAFLRCIVFGFYPTVIVLYLVYFPLFALACGAIGKIKNKKIRYAVLIVSVAAMTACFSLLDDVITPLMMGFNNKAWLMYFYSSFLAMVPQTICAIISVFALYPPLAILFDKLKVKYFNVECDNKNVESAHL